MKTPNTLTATLAAFAGLSFAVAYAAPSYVPDANSPINATPLLNSSSTLLNNYDDYISVINAHLTGTDTLKLPTPGGSTFPLFASYNAAVAAAAAADPAHVQQIVAAATQYRGGNYADKVKDIVKLIATNTPALAEDAVIGATAANPAKVADAASGAILGIILSTAAGTADYGDIADGTVTLSTDAAIEKIAKAAVSATKKSPTSTPINAVKVAQAITIAVKADGVTLYLDALARGLVGGAASITPTSQADVAAATLDLMTGAYGNVRSVAEIATGALKALPVGSAGYTAVLNALKGSTVGASYVASINAVDAAHQGLRNAPSGGEGAALQTALTATYATQLEAFMIGAVENKSSKSADLVTALLTDPDAGTPSNAVKQAVVGAAVRGKFSNAGKVTTAAINASSNALSRSLTVAAAIPNATYDYAGAIAGAAVKTTTALSNTGTVGDDQADDVASAALSAAVAAGYQGAINDIALQAAKAKKLEASAIVQTMITNADSAGWREAIVASAVLNNKADIANIKIGAAAGAAAAGSSNFEKASLALTADITLNAKTFNKVIFDSAVGDYFGLDIDVNGTPTPATQFTKAFLFGRGSVNSKIAGPLLALAMKYNTGTETNASLLAIAKSIFKKNAPVLNIQYTIIQDALANPDQLFDLVDHETATNLAKYSPDIAAAAAAARPEYAHIVARAASFRSPANAGKIGAAAITYAHMKSNRDASGAPILDPNDPAAVAAISAATILGIKDAKLPTAPTDKELAAVKAAAGALVKAAIGLDDNDTTFRQSDGGAGTFVPSKAKGTAGAVTGIIAEIAGYGGSSTTTLSTLAATAITAAVKADKKSSLEIAQAAAQALQFVYQLNGGVGQISFEAAIVSALSAGGAVGNIANAVHFGVTEAVALHYGAGAAGILNYAHRSGLLPAITSLENF